nr:hypothetical protein [Haliscomenobacter sp.]
MVEYLSVPSTSLVHGEGLSFDELALVEPLAIGAHGVQRANISKGEFVLVIGAGVRRFWAPWSLPGSQAEKSSPWTHPMNTACSFVRKEKLQGALRGQCTCHKCCRATDGCYQWGYAHSGLLMPRAARKPSIVLFNTWRMEEGMS